ncbi:flagellar export chaperone FlgN [Parahaliea mediterranea]|uniref:Flagellar protein FlgN n=1 Tax=Parahaliea mediterranea TaxID=651086 RepID=A0A939DCV0_9GAMM|nr:flagellar protein FlgN [Parahaliea mediterranea]
MSLAAHLQGQRARLEHLVSLLREEQQLLARDRVDGERLGHIAGEKQEQLAAIDSFEAQRRAAQQRLGYAQGRAGAEQAAREAGCLPVWQGIDRLAQDAAHLNTLNGELVHMRLDHNQRMLNFLREAAGSHLYGPDGQSRKNQGQVNSRA